MIPGLLAKEVSDALKEFIVTGFETETAPFSGEFRRLVEEHQDGQAFIKGPFVSIGLPFIQGQSGQDFFSMLKTEYPAYAHQEQAWQRLDSDRNPQNTLVATGTGSGKTECFLYPLLDHCQRHPEHGIKAIVIYPMNALATDQAKRFAEIIHQQEALKGVRVGLFVGGDGQGSQVMSPKQVITSKTALRESPPDILLTNYKMLDYLLMRPTDQSLWAHNGPDTLRYLVVDELHTFDGAQGTDLSLLIRRLRARFDMAPNQLICVGTSATLGDENSSAGLLGYAADVFSSRFQPDSVIMEQRQSASEFLDNIAFIPNHSLKPEVLESALSRSLSDYLSCAYKLYFSKPPEVNLMNLDGRIQLGQQLRQHSQIANLLRQFTISMGTPTFGELTEKLAGQGPKEFSRKPEQALLALLALVAHARNPYGGPWVQLRLQLWVRELRRIVGHLAEPQQDDDADDSWMSEAYERQESNFRPPLLAFGDDQPPKDQQQVRLPLVQCRECHGTAWLTRMELSHPTGQIVKTDLQAIYSAFFSNDRETTLLLPYQGDTTESPAGMTLQHFKLCRACGTTTALDHQNPCPGCQADPNHLVRVSKPHQLKEETQHKVKTTVHTHDCPYCAAKSALVVFGARAASLSAIAIHQLFSSRDNDDRKLLAFSDSVQDATHRAGFFAGRTWQNNVRMALSQMLQSQLAPLPLLELPARFEAYWLQENNGAGRLPMARYLKEFMPPDKRFSADFEHFETTGEVRNPDRQRELIRKRMLWQALEDLSWRSRVGRSLNHLGIAALHWPDAPVLAAASDWQQDADNRLGYRIDRAAAEGVMLGLMQRLVQLGALGLDDLALYRANFGKSFLLTRIPYAPRLGPSSPRPRYPSLTKGEGLEPLSQGQRGTTWYENWLACLNPDAMVDRQQLEAVLASALDHLMEQGLVRREQTERGQSLWMLEPEALSITTQVQAVLCTSYRPLHVSAVQAEHWLERPMIGATHPELRYTRVTDVRSSLYRDLFMNGEIHRVISHEHTGMLAPSERERVENSFISGQKEWEFNLLSATPTLEMGIDIGDLSSVVLCSVPPAQANYLQRIGRGGRRDGNAFTLTVANGRPHDLVFYADPARMLDTPVEPPAVFLKARHVLRRQLLAYTMDCWTRWAKGDNQIPRTMQPVLDAVESQREDQFPYNLLNFLKHNMQDIWEGFSEHVAAELADDDLELMRQYLFGGQHHQGDHLQLYVVNQLKQIVDDRQRMGDTIKDLDKQLTKLKKRPQDEHTEKLIDELEREAAGYRGMRVRLNKRETLNFFTDEGLLPNYAFPEEGTTLHSVIFRADQGGADGAEREFVKREYEYQRPAQAALTELAPESVFYAGNRRVKINRVETARGRNLQDWRFCPRCHYSAPADDPDAGFTNKTCPRCGTMHWSDASARSRMLRMTQVYAFTNARDAMLDDRSDDREPVFFNKQMLIDFKPADVAITWVLDDKDKPFGFEFIRSAHFLEVNFGRREGEEMMFEVAGDRIQRAGFPICRECGSVQTRAAAAGNAEAVHLKSCSYANKIRTNPDGSEDNGIDNCLYLYRQFASEALRILLPRLSTGGTEEQVNSFVAALQLGLKRRFGGKVDHLRVAYQSEPVGETDDRRHFIVLYDSVPGGTGYLHDLLSNVDNMQSVFGKAYDTMRKCDCYDGTMDGCYRCLLEYRNSYGMESTSKQLALEMLHDIVTSEANWVQENKGLSAMAGNPWMDSELEARFPEALSRFSGADSVHGQRVCVSQDIVKGKHGYRVIIGNIAYDMEPQVDLGAAQGVQFASKPDFVLWPSNTEFRPVAVFLDGYAYHAESASEDLLKRQAMMRAGFTVWTLNWYDINQVMGDKATDVPLLNGLTSPEQHHQAIAALAQKAGMANVSDLLSRTPFELLLHALIEPNQQAFQLQALFFTLQCLPAKSFSDSAVQKVVQSALRGLPVNFTDHAPETATMMGAVDIRDSQEAAVLSLHLVAGQGLFNTVDLNEVLVSACYELKPGKADQARFQWQRFWGAVNLLQFLPLFYAWTPDSKTSGIAAGLQWTLSKATWDLTSTNPEVTHSHTDEQLFLPNWFEQIEPNLRSALQELPINWPTKARIGDEVSAGALDEVVGEAEILFDTLKVALLLPEYPDQQAAKQHLEAAGWRCCESAAELGAVVNELDSGA